jgi:[ribosomal protein S18]-alanine N-acetyltransferase
MIRKWGLIQMNNVEIFPIEDKYIDDILNISMLSFPVSWSKDSIEKELDNSFARYVVALIDNIVIGFGGMWVVIDEAHITNIAVHPEYRTFGVGSMLLEALIDICKLEGCSAMTLEVRRSNFKAQGLYNKYGFLQEGLRKGYYEDNKEDAIIMWKRNLQKL